MLRRLLLLTLTLVCGFAAQAQFRYTFKDTATPYAPLSGASSVNSGNIWDEEDYSIPMPFTWKMDSTISLTNFNLSLSLASVLENMTNYSDLNGFILGDMDIADRGLLTNTSSMSPIRYLTTGTAPNRIFKVELANAGFWNEFYFYNTMSDYINLQVWVYESGIVELHYGASQISNPTDYFGFGGTGPVTGYLKHLNASTGSGGTIYYLKGSPAAPAIDTLIYLPSSTLNNQLFSWPASGKVYRFTPKAFTPVPCTLPRPVAAFLQDTTIGRVVQFSYTGTTANLDSLVWNFGDGEQYKIAGNYTTPVSHIFHADGRQNVCVSAYNRCGGDTVCRQTAALAVGNLSALGNVRVYPNPTTDYLHIEGMEAGGKAVLLSVVGRQVLAATINSSHQMLDISALPAGSYMLLLTNQQGVSATVRLTRQ